MICHRVRSFPLLAYENAKGSVGEPFVGGSFCTWPSASHAHTGDLFTDQLLGDRRFTRLTSKEAAQKVYDQVVRAAGRELFLLIKAKLVAVESKRITIKDEFLACMVMPDGRTVSEWLQPQLEDAYTSGKMPPLLPGPP